MHREQCQTLQHWTWGHHWFNGLTFNVILPFAACNIEILKRIIKVGWCSQAIIVITCHVMYAVILWHHCIHVMWCMQWCHNIGISFVCYFQQFSHDNNNKLGDLRNNSSTAVLQQQGSMFKAQFGFFLCRVCMFFHRYCVGFPWVISSQYPWPMH